MISSIRKSLPELGLESLMIVLSVLLALAASSWADSRKQAHLSDQATRAFAQEMRANRQRIAAVIPYQDSLLAAIQHTDSIGPVHSYAEWRRDFPGWSGFRPPDPTSSAWQSALSTGALTDIPFGTVAKLADIYSIQSKLDGFSMSYLPSIDFADASMPGTVRRMSAYVQTLLSYERYLLAHYDTTLATLDGRKVGS